MADAETPSEMAQVDDPQDGGDDVEGHLFGALIFQQALPKVPPPKPTGGKVTMHDIHITS